VISKSIMWTIYIRWHLYL